MKTSKYVFYLNTLIGIAIICIFVACSSNKPCGGIVKVPVTDNSNDTIILNEHTYFLSKQNLYLDTIIANLYFSNEAIVDKYSWKDVKRLRNYDTIVIKPLNFKTDRKEIFHQFLLLFDIIGSYKGLIIDGHMKKSIIDSIIINSSSFFDLDQNFPLTVLDTINIEYETIDNEIKNTNLFVEININKFEESNLNKLFVKLDTMHFGQSTIYKYTSDNLMNNDVIFDIKLKTDNADLKANSYLYDFNIFNDSEYWHPK